MKKIFLSASIPSPLRNEKYYDTADFMAIREAVRSLAIVVIPKTILVWGGHPAITPIISNVLKAMNSDIQKHVLVYQSRFFEEKFPKENNNIGQIVLTDKVEDDRGKSLLLMREKMNIPQVYSLEAWKVLKKNLICFLNSIQIQYLCLLLQPVLRLKLFMKKLQMLLINN